MPVTEIDHAEILKDLEYLTPSEQKQVLELLAWSPREKVNLFDLFIRTKPPESKLVRLDPNETQVLYLDDIQKECPEFDWRNKKCDLQGIRLDVLKYRQWGCSTITIGLYLIDSINNPYTQSRVIAHNPKTTYDLLQIARIMYDNFPKDKKPGLVFDNRGEMTFDNGSSFEVLKVGSRGSGRGGTIKNLLESERGWWPTDGNEVEFGVLQSVPEGGNVVRETTANGLNDFYQQYTAALEGRGDYKALFYGWAPHKEYSRFVPDNFEPNEEEKRLVELYGLTEGQLMFRRKRKEEAERLGKSFEQEYPLNYVEAFVGGGGSYYNTKFLLNLVMELEKPEHQPMYEVDAGVQGFHAPFKVYREPEHGREYLIGIDPAGGGKKGGEQDHTSLHVFDLETWEECLHYHGDPEPWDAGLDAAGLGAWYNEAPIAVLRLNHGGEVLRALREVGYSGIVQDEDQKYGLLENVRTKVLLDDKLGTVINDMAREEPGLILHSVETVKELITYEKRPGETAGAAGTAHDDRQCSLKVCVWQLIRDDRRFNVIKKEPPIPTPAFGRRGI